MSVITAVEQQKSRADRYSVFVDGRFTAGVSEAVVVELALHVGKPVGADDLRAIADAEDLHKALDDAFSLLSVRARSEREITTRLGRKGHGEETVQRVIEKLRRLGLVDDSEFAAQWVAARAGGESARPMGKRRLASELFQKGIEKETVTEALESVTEEDEMDLARAAARKKVRAIPTDPAALRAERQKLIGYLQRRGFGWDTIKRVAEEVFSQEDPFEDG